MEFVAEPLSVFWLVVGPPVPETMFVIASEILPTEWPHV